MLLHALNMGPILYSLFLAVLMSRILDAKIFICTIDRYVETLQLMEFDTQMLEQQVQGCVRFPIAKTTSILRRKGGKQRHKIGRDGEMTHRAGAHALHVGALDSIPTN